MVAMCYLWAGLHELLDRQVSQALMFGVPLDNSVTIRMPLLGCTWLTLLGLGGVRAIYSCGARYCLSRADN